MLYLYYIFLPFETWKNIYVLITLPEMRLAWKLLQCEYAKLGGGSTMREGVQKTVHMLFIFTHMCRKNVFFSLVEATCQ